MTTTATTPPLTLATTAAVQRGFGALPCILCGEEAALSVDLDDCTTFRCPECENEFTADDVRTHLASWSRVLNWLDSAPVAE